MRSWILCFSLGVFAGGFIPVLPDSRIITLLWLPLLASRWWQSLSLAAAFCLGLWWLLFQAITQQRHILPEALEQRDLQVSGVVQGLPATDARSTRLQFQADSVCVVEAGHCRPLQEQGGLKLLLNDYDNNNEKRSFLPGEHWLLQVRLKRPHGFANPGTFDYERWLFQQRISATGYVRQGHVVSDGSPGQARFFGRLRLRFRHWLQQQSLQSPAFIAALTIGERDGLDDHQWALLSRTGTNHLMVISGLHIGLVAWLVFHTARVLLTRVPHLGVWVAVPKLAAGVAIGAAWIYSGMAGFSLPVQRALVMVCCLMSGLLFTRQTAPTNSLCLALLLVLLLDPLAPQSAGFWLSFAAVALLLLAVSRQEPEAGILARARILLQTQGILFLGMLPMMLVLFGQVSLLAPVVNLVAIPFIGLVVVPLCLLTLVAALVLPALATRLVGVPDFLLANYEQGLAVLVRHLDSLFVEFPALPWWLTVLLATVLLILRCRPHWWAWTGLAGVLFYCLSFRSPRPLPGDFTLDILDVGQGLAAVVTTYDHLLVYDTGPAYSEGFNAGEGVVIPFLRAMNAGVPDTIMVSHGDSDHAGGLAALQARYPDAHYLVGEALPQSTASTQPCLAGQSWQWNGVLFDVLSPQLATLTGNNASCVLKISTGNYSVLLPGDIEETAELDLIRHAREVLKATILVAPHHGSATSSTPPFVRYTAPRHVVFTTGYLNRFGHPRPEVMRRYRQLGSQIHLTADTGTVRFHVSPHTGVSPASHFRETRPRFWSP